MRYFLFIIVLLFEQILPPSIYNPHLAPIEIESNNTCNDNNKPPI